MAQYSLLSVCLKEKPIKYLGPVQRLPYICEMLKKYRLGQHEGILWRFSRVYEMLEEHSYKTSVTVSTDLEILNDLKEFIFEHLSDKSNNAKEQSDANAIYKQLCAGRGDLVLKKENIIVIVSLAGALRKTSNRAFFSGTLPLISCIIPIIKTKTQAWTNVQIIELCARHSVFKDKAIIEGRTEACQKLLEVNTEVPPLQVEGDKSKSMLFEACRLAKSLQSLEITEKEKWEMMCDVWVEMPVLCCKPVWMESARQAAEARRRAAHPCVASHGPFWYK
ncbi:hypothetical protein CK203_057941 [Vitis vinifera]|uniref:Uncharacterized protein n=1 Tax=Vitis vinifera TaxID=29760 RepID=A0A438GMT0_VITVI|nr:hypothetical protein CK203_057941 [Vitis vinifera]